MEDGDEGTVEARPFLESDAPFGNDHRPGDGVDAEPDFLRLLVRLDAPDDMLSRAGYGAKVSSHPLIPAVTMEEDINQHSATP